jgi:hypothetical protein
MADSGSPESSSTNCSTGSHAAGTSLIEANENVQQLLSPPGGREDYRQEDPTSG